MTIVTAPATYDGRLPTVFLAGGIGGCPDWQSEVPALLPSHVALLNPRQREFDMSDPLAATRQVRWEKAALRRADILLFWFPEPVDPGVVQPIAFLELGLYVCGTSRPAVVGASRGFRRRDDVVLQLEDTRPEILVHDRLEAVCEGVTEMLARATRGA